MAAYKKAFAPTEQQRRQVLRYVGFGLTLAQIATVIYDPETDRPISERTLQRYFREELATGAVQAVANVAGALYSQAMKGNVAAQIFFLKCRGRWKGVAVEDDLDERAPATTTPAKAAADARNLVLTELEQMGSRLRAVAGRSNGAHAPNGAGENTPETFH